VEGRGGVDSIFEVEHASVRRPAEGAFEVGKHEVVLLHNRQNRGLQFIEQSVKTRLPPLDLRRKTSIAHHDHL
jgi:hypothetical protein